MSKINIKINNKGYAAKKGQTILEVVQENDLYIPTLCKHPDLKIQGRCRVCLVELGNGELVTSCSTPVVNGMEVKLDTKSVERARKINLEMIYAEHIEKCDDCIQSDSCPLKNYAEKYGARIARFHDRKRDRKVWDFGEPGFIRFDSSKCIDCGICTEVCKEKQAVDFYETVNKGYLTETKPIDDEARDCTYCGQCAVHCPVGAIQGVPHWQEIDQLLRKKGKKILVGQIAPSIRVSIGEEFGMDYGEVVTGQLASSMRKLGFDAAFDVTTGADFTTYEEARELIHWLKSGKPRPMFTSCCPGWIKFVEFFHPDFISHLTTTRSPQIISGILTKTYWADLTRKKIEDIVVVSVMPCTAKKQEISLERHKIETKNGMVPPVDYVMTTREYAYLLKKRKIDFPKLKPEQMDNPLGTESGAAVIYGASGGVMESALRTADYFLRVEKEMGSLEPILNGEKVNLENFKYSKIKNSRIEFKEARGQEGIKEAEVEVGGIKLKVAVANGLGNAKILLDNIRDKKVSYDYVEVMACPGGCIGGGGQPVPVTAEIRKKRAASLYTLDKNLKIRTAHENLSLLNVYQNYFRGSEEVAEELMHSDYEAAKRAGYHEINLATS